MKRKIYGDPADEDNVFHWSHVDLNCPGSASYQCGRPWISKRRRTGELAADLHDYCDDLRGTAPTSEEAWQVGSAISQQASFYGVQDALRKRWFQSQRPGAWARVVCGTVPDRVFISVSLEKWQKGKSEIQRLRDAFSLASAPEGKGLIKHKLLEEVAGFLNHLARAFPSIHVFLNGIYATMNMWQPDRDEEGWKMGDVKIEYDSATPPVIGQDSTSIGFGHYCSRDVDQVQGSA